MLLTALIVDDDPAFAIHLQELLKKDHPEVHVSGVYHKPEDALVMLKKTVPDVVFLDVEMPGLTGVELLDYFPHRSFEVVFTTSHDKYALQAIKSNAFDYLLKPVSRLELANALSRIAEKSKTLLTSKRDPLSAKIPVFSAEGVMLIEVKDIVTCRADNNYTTFFMADGKKVVASKSIGDIEVQLTPHGFFRPHKSHLINLNQLSGVVKADGGYILMKDKSQVPLARAKKDELMRLLEKLLGN